MKKQITLITSLTTLSTPVAADDFWEKLYTTPSSLRMETTFDEAGAYDLFSSLDLTLPNEHRFYGYISQGHSNDELDNPNNSYGFSFSSDPGKTVSLSVGTDIRAQESSMDIEGYSIGLSFSFGDWLLSATGQSRDIYLYTRSDIRQQFPRVPDRIRTDGTGSTFSLGYYGAEKWSIDAYYREERFNRDLSRLAESLILQLAFTQGALDSTWNLASEDKGFNLSYYLDRSYFTASYSQTTSAVDGLAYKYASLRIGYDLSDSWALEAEGGVGFADNEENYDYATLGAIYRWY